ncbi:NACHT domain-containing protein [Yinghuangia soli]|uniref:NACHT domain-containing protein n=1 Tax=Yinghuangia soli TaxID=2908204 RepID=A0AA41PUL8_9ACTN|nr:NACHT domain-containing protein [Yinghuangia soli]MCF2526001.1 NACHT domain-containing protein [Yinghuangia soli]
MDWASVTGIGVGAGLFLAGVVLALLKDSIEKAAAKLYNLALDRLAGSALLRRTVLKRYARSVAEAYEAVPVPFATRGTLKMSEIYVPLAVHEFGWADERRDAYEVLHAHRRAVVIGDPGAGKSVLLRHSLLRWATAPKPGRGAVAVLVELHRLNGLVDVEGPDAFRRLIVDQFARHRFPRADKFVARRLEAGTLTVYLDGLDEVDSADRMRAMGGIRDFATAYPECRIVVSCRSAVYDGGLRPEFADEVRIGEFDDRLMRRFLEAWPGLPEGRSTVEQLMAALRNAPRVMQLARNPLLLTMIAWLYSEVYVHSGKRLPHSRAEFYNEVTTELLHRWNNRHNRYVGPEKKIVLQAVALAAMENGGVMDADRLALPYHEVVRLIAEKLPDLNRDPSEAREMLDEIVHRSGLLVYVDGGDKVQFAHLTLQEFFAARQLQDRPDELLGRFRNDRLRWRETVLLWCGMAERDCTEFLEQLFAVDGLLAFEALAEVHAVADEIADLIVAYAQERAEHNASAPRPGWGFTGEFGRVAAARTPRGERTLAYLASVLADPGNGAGLHRFAADALAYTSLPEAAEILVRSFARSQEAFSALAAMREIAIPALEPIADTGRPWGREQMLVVSLVQGMGPGPAALMLVPWLADDDARALCAALCLASMAGEWQRYVGPQPDNGWRWSTRPTQGEAEAWLVGRLWDARVPGRTDDVIGRIGKLLLHAPEADSIWIDVPLGTGRRRGAGRQEQPALRETVRPE